MRAQVISIASVSKTSTHLWREEAVQEGFTKALGALASLKGCSMRETIIALENWQTAGLMSEAEVTELYSFHGWRRGQ